MTLKKSTVTVNCPNCGVTLLKIEHSNTQLELKCSGCKKLILIKAQEDGTISTKLKNKPRTTKESS